ncbi:MAG: hypothetical protein IKI88_05250 [Anaerotignum sp.]|nr:hypothetical protein [Anaerotignum sp.]
MPYAVSILQSRDTILLPPSPLRAPGVPVVRPTAYCCQACRKIIIEYNAE